MTDWLDVLLPLLVIFVMTVVGLELRAADFFRLRRYPVVLPALVLGQWALLAGLAVLLARWSAVPRPAACGLLLLAAAPVAPIANYYAQLARASVALAVTTTALSSVLAAVVTPIVATLGFRLALGEQAAFTLPLVRVAQQTVIGLVLPLGVGMIIRRLVPGWVAAWRPVLQALSLVAVVVVVGGVLVDQRAVITTELAGYLLAAGLFTGVLLVAGALVTRVVLAPGPDRRALLWGFPGRNVAVATLLAEAALGDRRVTAFVAVLFVLQTGIVVPLALWSGLRHDDG
jgi:BASS family bile acid:Na+ symporter